MEEIILHFFPSKNPLRTIYTHMCIKYIYIYTVNSRRGWSKRKIIWLLYFKIDLPKKLYQQLCFFNKNILTLFMNWIFFYTYVICYQWFLRCFSFLKLLSFLFCCLGMSVRFLWWAFRIWVSIIIIITIMSSSHFR